ncbi:MAG: cytidylate kinase family protein [Patescibacteria group bacterium]|nr:cytidylate kinase family protein [Patescibacteria group bacterium]
MAIIAISGSVGCGKTTIGKRLAENLGYKYHYTGGIFKEMAQKEGKTINEFYEEIKANPAIEKEIDARQEKLMMESDNLVVEGRMAPFLDCGSNKIKINVKITASLSELANRLAKRPENQEKNINIIKKEARQRMKTEKERYRKLYGIEDYLADKHFDVIIDTTNLSADEAFKKTKNKIDYFIRKKQGA